jgi:hypothetical protein
MSSPTKKFGGVGQNMIPKYFEPEEKILNLGEDGAEKTLTLNMARNFARNRTIITSAHPQNKAKKRNIS